MDALNHEALTRKVTGQKKNVINFRFYRFALIQFTEITGDFYLHLRERNKRRSLPDTICEAFKMNGAPVHLNYRMCKQLGC